METSSDWLLSNGKYECPHCGKEYTKKGIGTHIWRTHGQGKNFDPNEGYKNGTRQSAFKGKTHSEESKQKLRDKVTGENNAFFGKHHTDEKKKQISNSMKENGTGGFNSRITIIYEKKDSSGEIVKLQSRYELKVAEGLDKHNIKWIRPTWFKWIDANNEWHKYYPDFYLIDYDIYLDPKNKYLIIRDKDKIDRVCIQNNIKVIILDETQLHWDTIQTLI